MADTETSNFWASWRIWRQFLRPGDSLFIGLSIAAVAFSFPLFWQNAAGEKAIVRLQGQIFMEADLNKPQEIFIKGPLGVTRILVEKGRARVASDPGTRQYCVRQGWLSKAGEIAICAPNQVSLAIVGKNAPYDSLNY